MHAVATVLCNNILARARADKIKVSPMKLQKLMYYTCRDYAQVAKVSPINESFEVWQYGPVLPSVYSEFKPFGPNPITSYARNSTGEAHQVSEAFNPTLAAALSAVWARHKRQSAVELSRLTHQKGSGWYKAYMRGDRTISLEDMLNDNTGR